MSSSLQGSEITTVFEFVQKVCGECQKILFGLDTAFIGGSGNNGQTQWQNPYGNQVTKDGSASLQFPEKWVIQRLFRIYEEKNESDGIKHDSRVRKCVMITFWGEGISEPIITAGKITYKDGEKNKAQWDLWELWKQGLDDKNSDISGNTYDLQSLSGDHPDKYEAAQWFSRSLVEITDGNALQEILITPLQTL